LGDRSSSTEAGNFAKHVRFYRNWQIFNKPVRLESELSRRGTADRQEVSDGMSEWLPPDGSH
jgi:hypothetical protein